ncbi:MAG: hypothetical protein JXA95_07350 [Spirochaetales bacterium]|nr:hypothetical protein [Spirochaetales bacterium]
MLNKYEYVIKTSDQVEQILISRYPYLNGLSFADKLSRLNNRLPLSVMRQLHTVRTQRNYIAHNQEYMFDYPSYDNALNAVHNWLGVPVTIIAPVEVREVSVTKVTEINRENKQLDPRKVLLAAGAGLAGIGIASLFGNNRDRY